jgi:hypothetical protein
MGHDEHFLTRLERLAQPEIDFAFALYRDPAIVRQVLKRLDLRDDEERVAFSIDDPGEGPFIIVARDGGFVTCLGRGMAVKPMTIVTRSRVDATMARFKDLRERWEENRHLAAKEGGVERLMNRLHEVGPALSREEFRAISAWGSILYDEFLRFRLKITVEMMTLHKQLRTHKLLRKDETAMRGFWGYTHMLHHLSLILAMGDAPRYYGEHVKDHPDEDVALWLMPLLAFELGWVPFAMRGIWSVAKIGKPLLPGFKRGLTKAQGTPMEPMYLLPLAAMGLRHSRVGAEVQKAIAPSPDQSGNMHDVRKLLLAIFEDRARYEELHRAAALELLDPARSPDLALSYFANAPLEFHNERDVFRAMCAALPWLANVEAEQIYLPAAHIDLVKDRWTPEQTMALIEPGMKYFQKEQPKVAAPKPGRNDPCSCGSGKKYKHCHGA